MSADLTIKIREDLDGRMFGKQAQHGIAAAGGGGGDLKAAWHLDDTSDSSGNGHTLTNNGSATFVTGKIGNCVNLASASSQYLSIAHHADFNPGDTNWSIGLWFNPTTASGTQALFSKMDGATAATYDLSWVAGSDLLVFSIFNDSFSTAGSVTVTPSFSSGTWYCITAKVDAGADLIYLRINDGAGPSNNNSTSSAMTSLGSVPLTIGARADTGDRRFVNGKIDAFHFWFKALSSAEETSFYNSGTGIEYP